MHQLTAPAVPFFVMLCGIMIIGHMTDIAMQNILDIYGAAHYLIM
jgi:hypothetical protein